MRVIAFAIVVASTSSIARAEPQVSADAVWLGIAQPSDPSRPLAIDVSATRELTSWLAIDAKLTVADERETSIGLTASRGPTTLAVRPRELSVGREARGCRVNLTLNRDLALGVQITLGL